MISKHKRAAEKAHKQAFPTNGTSHQKAAHAAGGTLLHAVVLPTIDKILGPNGGCGAPIKMTGTNGGSFPCGSVVGGLVERKPYYCTYCKERLEAVCLNKRSIS